MILTDLSLGLSLGLGGGFGPVNVGLSLPLIPPLFGTGNGLSLRDVASGPDRKGITTGVTLATYMLGHMCIATKTKTDCYVGGWGMREPCDRNGNLRCCVCGHSQAWDIIGGRGERSAPCRKPLLVPPCHPDMFARLGHRRRH